MLQPKFFAATDVGRQREHNEDAYLVEPRLGLFIVADGMGGHAAGEVASGMAIKDVARVLRDNSDAFDRYRDAPDDDLREEILHILEHAVQSACSAIFLRSQQESDKRGMGTTCTAMIVVRDRAFVAHVGDTRVYLLRDKQVHQLTEDHSLINELVRRGRLKREDIDSSPYAKFKNAVTRAVGAYETVEVETADYEVVVGDQFLLCSDGLHAYLESKDMPQLLSAEDIADVPRTLVDLANSGGGHDNITAIVVRLEDSEQQQGAERASDLANRIDVLKSMRLFQGLVYPEIMRLLNVMKVHRFANAQTLIEEDTVGDSLFVLLAGKVKLQKAGADIATLSRGAHLGEMSLVDQGLRSATAIADGEVSVLVLSRRDFEAILRTESVLAQKILWSFLQELTQRLRKTTQALSDSQLAAEAVDLSNDILEESTATDVAMPMRGPLVPATTDPNIKLGSKSVPKPLSKPAAAKPVAAAPTLAPPKPSKPTPTKG
jgi:serine/threonine protein phosphatase PrpC/CRP-like cAMP-binding protein